MKRLLAFLVALMIVVGGYLTSQATAHAVTGNPPGTTCTGYRYGKGGGKTCIRWTPYPGPTTTTAP